MAPVSILEIGIGKIYGRLTVIAELERTSKYRRRALCQCACGKQHSVDWISLRGGGVKSCGCLRDETSRARMIRLKGALGSKGHRTHGRSNTPEFYVWDTMKQRCSNPKTRSYPRYGGRGITVCERWLHSFENFLADMGERPSPKHSLDRIDNDLGYSPENCRWATMTEQHRNRSSNVLITHDSITLPISAWAERLGISKHGILHRLRRGCPPAEVLLLDRK